MKDIKCPSCGKTFKIDPSNFDQLSLKLRMMNLTNKLMKD